MRSCLISLLLMLPAVAAIADGGASPQQRYDDAKSLMQSGRYADAATAFAAVAAAPDAPVSLQQQALFVAGMMYQQARDYPRAVATYDEVQRRFPNTDTAQRAAGSAAELRAGSSRWLEFRQRQDEAWDVFEPARERAQTDGLGAARGDLQRAATLLRSLLDDFPEHPRAKDVATALATTYLSLRRFDEAATTYERAIELARAQNATTGIPVDSFIAVAADDAHAALRAGRRYHLTGLAVAILAIIALGLIALRPWGVAYANTRHLLAPMALTIALVTALAATSAYVVRYFIDENSPITWMHAIVLAAIPGLMGALTTHMYGGALAARAVGDEIKAYTIAAAIAALAALAVSVCLMSQFELLSFLDSEL